MKVGFLYNSQNHQILHSLPTALELSILRPDWQVDLLAPSQSHLDYIQGFTPFYPGARVNLRLLEQPWPVRAYRALKPLPVPPKLISLWSNRGLLNGYDALVCTDKTSLLLRRFGWVRPRLINTEHGAGDRDVTFDPRVADFDYNLIPSPKSVSRLLEAGYLTEGKYACAAYAKFDLVNRLTETRPQLFANGRPTILYNPHFEKKLSSWHTLGMQVLMVMAAQDRYNLIFAPHMRLFDPPTAAKRKAFDRFQGLDHIRIDLGSDASCDMTYTQGADLYLGDVSSQVYEFLYRPRPCVFLNAHGVDWQSDPNYRFWTLGSVLAPADVAALPFRLDAAFAQHDQWRQAQQDAFAANFDLTIANPGRYNAGLLVNWLERSI